MNNQAKQRKIYTIIFRAGTVLGSAFLALIIAIGLFFLQNLNIRVLTWIVGIGFFLSLLSFFVCLFSFLSIWLRKTTHGIVCFAVLFVLGCTSYFIWHVDREDDVGSKTNVENVNASSTKTEKAQDFLQFVMECPNRAVSAFFPSRGGFEHLERRDRCLYYFFHLVVLVFIATIMFSHFGREVTNMFRKKYIYRFCLNRLNVFWGFDDVGYMMAKNIINTDALEQVVFILPNELRLNEEAFKTVLWKLDSIDAVWITTDFSNPDRSDLYGHKHFFLNDVGHINISNADRFVKKMKALNINKPDDVFLFVRIGNDDDKEIVDGWVDSVSGSVTACTVDGGVMIARKFINDYPMLTCPGLNIDTDTALVKGACKVLLIGFGWVGKRLLWEMITTGQYKGMDESFIDVVEKSREAINDFCCKFDVNEDMQVKIEKYTITFINKDFKLNGTSRNDLLSNGFEKYNRIIVCLGDDVENVHFASQIANLVSKDKATIFVQVSDPERNNYLPNIENIKTFGNLSDVYTLSNFNHDKIEKIAMRLNAKWVKKPSEEITEEIAREHWRKAKIEDKESSRSSASGELNLVRLLGFEVVQKYDERVAVNEEEFSKTINDHNRKKTLAEGEHLRWNAYNRMLGYSCWDLKDPKIENMEKKDIKANQIDKFGKHAAIVNFDELPFVDYKIACAIDSRNEKELKVEDFENREVKCWCFDGKSGTIVKESKTSLQGNDYNFVDEIWTNIKEVDMKIVKTQI